jgi:hypothetical protein
MYYRLNTLLSGIARSTKPLPVGQDPNSPQTLAKRAQLKAASPLQNLIKTPRPQAPLRRYTGTVAVKTTVNRIVLTE